MSRTWKRHTHIAAGDSYALASKKARKSRIRSQVKEALRNFDEDSEADLTQEASIKKSSSGYFYDTEKDCLKAYRALKSSLLNGADTTSPYCSGALSRDIDKKLISEYCRVNGLTIPRLTDPDSSEEREFIRNTKKEYVLNAILELDEQVVADIIHSAYASKGN